MFTLSRRVSSIIIIIIIIILWALAVLLFLYSYSEMAFSKRNLKHSGLAFSHAKKCPSLQISCHDGGRLANQISSYATLVAVSANLTEYSPFVTEHTYSELTSLFTGISIYPHRNCEPKENLTLVDLRGPVDKYPKFLEVHSSLKQSQLPKYILLGWYPVNPNIFHQYRDKILKEFTFSIKLKEEVHEYLTWLRSSQLISNTTKLVSVHVRRDDYQGHLGRLVEVEFFKRAIAALRESLNKSNIDTEKLVFITTSDDPSWCKENMPVLNEVMFFTKDYYTNVKNVMNTRDFDLALAASCDHAIFDYGTYGFWGAYLQNNHNESHVVMGDGVWEKIKWDVVSVKETHIPHWSFVKAFMDNIEMSQ